MIFLRQSPWPLRAIRMAALCLLLACAHCLTVPTVHAKPPSGSADDRRRASAKTMAEQAGKAYEGGDFQRAALLYINAWQTDDETPDYLFAAARAAHVGGLLDMAVEHYEAYLKVPGIDAARDKKARAYLEDIREAKAASKGAEAEKAMRTGDALLGVQLYRQAFQLAPHRHEYRFKAAVALQGAGQLADAEALLVAYLAESPADAVDRPEADARLSSLRKGRMTVTPAPAPAPKPQPVVVPPPVVVAPPVPAPKPVPAPVITPAPVVTPLPAPQPQPKPVPVVAPAPNPVIQKPAPSPSVRSNGPSRTLGWVLLGGGVLLVAGGGVAFYQQWVDTQAYQNPTRDVTGLITNMTLAEGTAKADAIDRNRAIGGVCVGLGTVGLGLGIWQLVRGGDEPHAVILPTPSGAALAGRF